MAKFGNNSPILDYGDYDDDWYDETTTIRLVSNKQGSDRSPKTTHAVVASTECIRLEPDLDARANVNNDAKGMASNGLPRARAPAYWSRFERSLEIIRNARE